MAELDRTVDAYSEMVRLSQVRYNSGLADYFEVLYSMQLLFPAQIALARARLDLLIDYVDIYKALGGGWNIENPTWQSPGTRRRRRPTCRNSRRRGRNRNRRSSEGFAETPGSSKGGRDAEARSSRPRRVASLRRHGRASAQNPPPAPTPAGPLEIYQVDLVPTGTGFAMTKPVLQGDVWVFKVWPDRSTVRLAQSKVKKITPRTKQLQSEEAYRVDLAPSGEMFSRDNPVLKGTTYTFHRWQGGNLMSLRQTDVKKITRLTPVEIFQAHLQYFGPEADGNLPMEGGTAVMPARPGSGRGASRIRRTTGSITGLQEWTTPGRRETRSWPRPATCRKLRLGNSGAGHP